MILEGLTLSGEGHRDSITISDDSFVVRKVARALAPACWIETLRSAITGLSVLYECRDRESSQLQVMNLGRTSVAECHRFLWHGQSRELIPLARRSDLHVPYRRQDRLRPD